MRKILLACVLLFNSLICYATHFAFGTVSWSIKQPLLTPTLVSFESPQAWRLDFPTWRNQLGRTPRVGDTKMNTGTWTFRGRPQTSTNINVAATPFLVTATHATDNWLQGVWLYDRDLGTTFDYWTMLFSSCCRLSTLLNNNKDANYIMNVNVNIKGLSLGRERSPKTTGLPREYVELNKDIYFQLPVQWAVDANGATKTGLFAFAPTPMSGLVIAQPMATNNVCTQYDPANPGAGATSCFYISPPTGDCFWKPSALGLYALQILIRDPGAGIPTATGVNFVPMDFIIEVLAACDGTNPNCNNPPFFVPLKPLDPDPFSTDQLCPCNCDPLNINSLACVTTCGAAVAACPIKKEMNYYEGVEGTHYVVVTDRDVQDNVELIYNGLPLTSVLTKVAEYKPTTVYSIIWAPLLEEVSTDVCFQARDSRGRYSFNKYCLTMMKKQAKILYISGTMRDFKQSHAGFALAPTPAAENKYAKIRLGANGLPELQPAAVAFAHLANYDQWWTTINGVNAEVSFSRTLTEVVPKSGIFTWFTSVFFPLDNALLGNEGLIHNYYFTYEVHTYLEYTPTVVGSPPQSFTFGSTDDLWVYVNWELVGGANWNLGGVHKNFIEYTLIMDTERTALGITPGENYRCDIFYANRGTTQDPGIKLQLPDSTICNALSAGLLQLDYDFSSMDHSNIFMKNIGVNTFLTTGVGLYLLPATALATQGASWFAERVNAQTRSLPVKVLQGFESYFEFKMDGNAEGFAFVIQSEDPNAVGDPASGLGYAGLKRSMAIEFDTRRTTTNNDPNQIGANPGVNANLPLSHVALTSNFDLANSANHAASIVKDISGTDPELTFTNNTWHTVRIRYSPPSEELGGVEGWLRVWIGNHRDPPSNLHTWVLSPVILAKLDSVTLRNTFGGAAYVGFTAGSSDIGANILIRNWNMTVVTLSASQTNLSPLTKSPRTWIAGENVKFVVQSRDACANKITVGEEQARFTAVVRGFYSGAVVYTLPASAITTNFDGTYNFEYQQTIAGLFKVSIMYDNAPIKGSPFAITIQPGETDVTKSEIVLGKLDVKFSNAPYGQGLYCALASRATGDIIRADVWDTVQPLASDRYGTGGSAGLLAFLNTYVPLQHILACAVIDNAAPAGHTERAVVDSKFQALGATELGNLVKDGSWAIILSNGVKEEGVFALNQVNIEHSFTGFKVVATSGGRGAGLENLCGYINVYPNPDRWTFSANSNFQSAFVIIARDAYDNLNTNGADSFSVAFSPELPPAQVQDPYAWDVSYRAFYKCDWYTTQSSAYNMFVKLNGVDISNSPQPITVLAGPPTHEIASTISGTGAEEAVAGVSTTFNLKLKDDFGNIINYDPSGYVNVQLVGSEIITTGVTVTGTTSWDANTNTFSVSYVTTKAGEYELVVTVSGTRMVNSVGQYVQVRAGPVDASKCIIGNDILQSGTFSQTIEVGVNTLYYIQSRDQYGNDIKIPIDANNLAYGFDVSFSLAANIQSSSIFYYQEGTYILRVYAITAAPAVNMKITYAVNGANINNPVQPGAGYAMVIKHGKPSTLSTMASPVIVGSLTAGVSHSFEVLAIDKHGNPCTEDVSQFFGVSFNAGLDIGSASIAYKGPSNQHTVTISATRAKLTTVNVIAKASLLSITNSPQTVTVVHAAPSCSATLPDTNAGVAKKGYQLGEGGTPAEFDIIVRDQYANSVRADFVPKPVFFGSCSNCAVGITFTECVACGTAMKFTASYTPNAGPYTISYGIGGTSCWTANLVGTLATDQYYLLPDPPIAIDPTITPSGFMPPATAGVAYTWCVFDTDLDYTKRRDTMVGVVPTSSVVLTVTEDGGIGEENYDATKGLKNLFDYFCTTWTPRKAATYTTQALSDGKAASILVGTTCVGQACPKFVKLVVKPGLCDPPSSEFGHVESTTKYPALTKFPTYDVIAGTQIRVLVDLRDKFSNSIHEVLYNGADSYLVSMRATRGAISVNGTCSFDTDEQWYCLLTPEKVGTYDVTSSVENFGSLSFSQEMRVLAALPAPSVCSTAACIKTSGPAVAGVTNLFSLEWFDAYGNTVADKDLTISFTLTTAGWTPADFQTFFTVSPMSDLGKYVVSFSTRKAGAVTFEISITSCTGCGATQYNTPVTHTVTVSPAAPDPASSTVTWITPSTVTAGDSAQFRLTVKDRFGNPWFDDVSRLSEIVTTPPGGNPFAPSIETDASTPNTGDYLIGLALCKFRGDWTFSLRVSGVDFNALAPSLTVLLGPIDADQTETTGQLEPAQAGVPVTFTYQLADMWGNKNMVAGEYDVDKVVFGVYVGTANCDLGGGDVDPDAFAFTFEPASGFTFDPVVDLGGGRIEVTLTATLISPVAYTLYFNYTDPVIGETTFTCAKMLQPAASALVVQPGLPWAETSVLTPIEPIPSQVVAGSTLFFSLDLKDRFGNSIEDTTVIRAFDSTNTTDPLIKVGVSYFESAGPQVPAEMDWIRVTALAFATSSPIQLSLTPTKAGDQKLRVSFPSGPNLVNMRVPSIDVITTIAAQAADYEIQTPVAFAGVPSTIVLQGLDEFGNANFTNYHNYEVTLSLEVIAATGESTMYTLRPDAVAAGSGQHNVYFTSAWSGTMYASVKMLNADNKYVPIDQGGNYVPKPPHQFSVRHATCAAEDPAKPYRCDAGSDPTLCVASYTDCNYPTACAAGTPILCPVDGTTCVADVQECPCPTGQERCSQGHCAVVGQCFSSDRVCPVDYPFKCDSGECRQLEADCSSVRVCPLGLILCPDTLACAVDLASCSDQSAPLCQSPNLQCPDGTCSSRLENCPTLVSCGTGVFCASDGSCQASVDKCPSVTLCSDPANSFRCPDGSCRADSTGCPTGVTCRWGQLLCPGGQCAPSFEDCPKFPQCSLDQVRCSDGSCVENIVLCPTKVTCNPLIPILCADGSCVADVQDCPAPKSCDLAQTSCPDGSCVECVPGGSDPCFDRCPQSITCPPNYPILCSDGMCVSDVAQCPKVASLCPADKDTRCPDGSCRANLADCSTGITCSSLKPVKCMDGQCAVSVDDCVPVEDLQCPSPLIRCFTGECADSESLCPTHATCPATHLRCPDGTCREDCPVDLQLPECGVGEVKCPVAASGVSCAPSLEACPSSVVCPERYPVRCLDNTCAETITNCPEPQPDNYYGDGVVCPDGTLKKSLRECVTAITCPSSSPYICFDSSCRVSPEDCPEIPVCPGPFDPANAVYSCVTGVCVAEMSDNRCFQTGNVCSELAPVKCADGSCVATLQDCSDPLLDAIAGIASGDISALNPCLPGVLCRDGSCAVDSSACAGLECPDYIPFACSDGMCAVDESKCNDRTTGCPYTRPFRCDDGVCYNSEDDCPPTQACADPSHPNRCSDGSCVGADVKDCPLPNGCDVGEIRCVDGTCVPDVDDNLCISGASLDGSMLPNTCPGLMVRCTGGYCAISDSSCVTPQQVCSDPSLPAACANGGCAVTEDQCATLAPCPTDPATGQQLQRCGSTGQCKPADLLYTCPGYPSDGTTWLFGCDAGFFRCTGDLVEYDSGICVPVQNWGESSCVDDSPTSVNGVKESCFAFGCPLPNGCPQIYPHKCLSDGRCVQDAAECANSVEKTAANGCPMDATYKCANGACVASATMCPYRNGCPQYPQDTPFRCNDGTCVAKEDQCTASTTCPAGFPNRCADGSCAASVDDCLSLNGCPVSQPVRCADGSCRLYPANVEGVPTDQKCSILVVCAANQFKCYDGSCVASKSFCPASVPCLNTALITEVQCPDKTCAADLASCPASASCPQTAPVTCPSGECKSKISECPASITSSGTQQGGIFVLPPPNDPSAVTQPPTRAPTIPVDAQNQPQYTLPLPGQPNGADWYSGVEDGCSLATPVRCFDGSCRASSLACNEWANQARGGELQGLVSCPRPLIQCGDGSCVNNFKQCPITKRCPQQVPWRCANGACMSLKSDCDAVLGSLEKCATGTKRCEDGMCREACLHFDGCPLTRPFHCPNRACSTVRDKNICDGEVSKSWTWQEPDYKTIKAVYQAVQPVSTSRRLQSTFGATDEFYRPCETNCLAQVKASAVTHAIGSDPVTLDIALDANKVVVGTLTIPSGAIITPGQPSSVLTIYPVADSTMRDAANNVHPSRQDAIGKDLSFSRTLLSPAFECVTSSNVTNPFPVAVVYTATIDYTMAPKTDEVFQRDVCFAYLMRIPELGYARWECVVSDYETRLNNPPAISGKNPARVRGNFYDCGAPGQGKVFGFIYSPLLEPRPPQIYEASFMEDYGLFLILGVLVLSAALAGALFAAQRLTRYRKKLHAERKKVETMKEQVDEMEQFGGQAGQKDDEVVMTSNPMSIQVKDLQKKMDDGDMETEKRKDELKAEEAAARGKHIESLKNDIEDLNKQLLQLKVQMEEANNTPMASHETEISVAAPAGGATAGATMPRQKATFKATKNSERKKKEVD